MSSYHFNPFKSIWVIIFLVVVFLCSFGFVYKYLESVQ